MVNSKFESEMASCVSKRLLCWFKNAFTFLLAHQVIKMDFHCLSF